MQFSHLHLKHPNILDTSAELSRLIFCLGSITSKTKEIDPRKKIDNESSFQVPLRKMFGVFKLQIRELHFYSPTPLYNFDCVTY